MYKRQSKFFKRVIARGGSKVKVFGQGARPTNKSAKNTAKPTLIKKEKQ